MKHALVLMAMILTSTAAFAAPRTACESKVASTPSVKQAALSFIADVETLAQMQIEQDGVMSLSGDVMGRVERARMIVKEIEAVEAGGETSDPSVLETVCNSNLDFMTAIYR